jgi:hypothetical protein
MNERRSIKLSRNGCTILVEETVNLDNERVVEVSELNSRGGRVAPSFDETFYPADAEKFGLALIAMAATARAKASKPGVFGYGHGNQSSFETMHEVIKGRAPKKSDRRQAERRASKRRTDDKRRNRLATSRSR